MQFQSKAHDDIDHQSALKQISRGGANNHDAAVRPERWCWRLPILDVKHASDLRKRTPRAQNIRKPNALAGRWR
ncbi:hypothetical protein LOC67_03135 [Stieleria sp. JC731]|uniref:hypothetical protein n=1 Tax=Pirellulaceae TaxID=2691357 RepID=UPI001E4F9899|nr:hypothetical protein [Stieleria sp. JC731]MCC9599541.1 hypothetical protein [Stieleria sp. JC731]